MEVATPLDHSLGKSSLNTQQAAELFAKRRESQRSPQDEASVRPESEPEGVLTEAVDSPADDVEALDSDSQEQTGDTEETESGPLALSEDQVVRLPDGTELPVKELTRGLLREADYTQKTQALSEQRKSFEQATETLSYHLGALKQAAVAELQRLQSIDWADLLEKDPVAFQKSQLRLQQAQQRYQAQQAQEQGFLGEVERVRKAEKAARVTEAVATLTRVYPGGWSEGEYHSLIDYAASIGWNRNEVAQWDSAQAFLTLRKARAFDEAQKVGTKKVVQASPGKTLKSTRGATAQPTVAKQKDSSMVSQLRNAGSKQEQTRLAAQILASRRGTDRPR
jgi:hypothetical protein